MSKWIPFFRYEMTQFTLHFPSYEKARKCRRKSNFIMYSKGCLIKGLLMHGFADLTQMNGEGGWMDGWYWVVGEAKLDSALHIE